MKSSIFRLTLFLFVLTIVSCAYDQDDNSGNNPNGELAEIIASDSDLFKNLQDITSDDVRPDKTIACIDFIYPLTIFVFDDTNEFESTNLILDDEQFSDILENLEIDYSISVSFPITSTLDTGEELIIENKEELKAAIDLCLNEELVFECNQLIQNCVWKIGYSYNFENPYLGGFFQESNGFTTLNLEGILLSGSWSPIIIENELHLNINLIDDTEITDFFNYDWIVEYIDENSLLLVNGDRELVLNQRCDPNFADCKNFVFEVCETELDSGISEHILDDYTFCIFDSLELDDTFEISYHETLEDVTDNLNAIPTEDVYVIEEETQSIYVRIYDEENDTIYTVEITLASISC